MDRIAPHRIPTPFLSLTCQHGSMRTCASDIAGARSGSTRCSGWGSRREVETDVPFPKKVSSPKSPTPASPPRRDFIGIVSLPASDPSTLSATLVCV